MDRPTRKRLFNALDPFHTLEPGYIVDLDGLPGELRGQRWAQWLADNVVFSDRPACLFFTGLTGSGKSTELRRAAGLLQEQDHRLVALIDANAYLDLQNEIDVPDVLAALVHGAEVEILKAEGTTDADAMEQALREGYAARLWNWVKDTDIELGRAEYSVPSGPKLVAEMKSRPTLRQRLRKALNAHINRFTEDVRSELDRLDQRARDAGFKNGLVLVLDSLERLQGTSGTYLDVLRSAERVLRRGAPWMDLPLPVIWTVPPELVTVARLDVAFLPMIKIRDRGGAAVPEGIDALREVVRRRLGTTDLGSLLGADPDDKLLALIEASGGYLRDLLRLLQKLVLRSPQQKDDVPRVVADLVDEVVRIVPVAAYPWLRRVHETKQIATRDEDEKRLADRLISNDVVLRYQNQVPWFDLHPAVRTIDAVVSPPPPVEDPAAP